MIGSLRHRQAGFTLIELMVTVLVVSILVGVAVPTYTNQMQKSRRTDARSAVLDIAAREERYMATSTAYSQTPSDLGYSGTFPQAVGAGYYNITVTLQGPPVGFIATATPVTTGPQANDTTCASFTIDQLGQRKATDSSNTDTSATC